MLYSNNGALGYYSFRKMMIIYAYFLIDKIHIKLVNILFNI